MKRNEPKEYNFFLKIIEKDIGNTTTTNHQLDAYCKEIFGDRFKGVFSIDTMHRLKNNECCIFNLDKSHEPGSHWCGLYKTNGLYIVYDSFGRKSHILGVPFKNVKTTENDPEQKIRETNCGARTTAFLCCCYTLPLKEVLKI